MDFITGLSPLPLRVCLHLSVSILFDPSTTNPLLGVAEVSVRRSVVIILYDRTGFALTRLHDDDYV